MKWITQLLLLSLLLLSSCCSTKKTKTITETVTTYKVDTVVKIKYDTVYKHTEAYLTDTLYIENTVAEARSYFNPIKNKIVLELRGKVFDVPIRVDVTKQQTTKQKTVEKKIPFTFYIFCFCGGMLFSYFIYLKTKK
jgi:hypothetical protein